METVFRVVFWSICLCGYSKLVLCKKGNDFNVKKEIAFSGVTAYALLIIIRSISFRFSQMIGLNDIGQEVITALGMLVTYAVIYKLGSFILKDRTEKWMCYCVSMVLIICVCTFILIGTIAREVYFVIYCSSFGISFFIAKYFDNLIEIPSNKVWRVRLKFSLPVSLFTGFSLFIYFPSELYVGNPQAFMVNYWSFIWPLAMTMGLFIASYLLVTLCFVTTRHYYVCNIFCLTYTVLSNIQNMFLNGTMKSMDGTEQQWDIKVVCVNALLWIIVFAVAYIASYFNKKKLRDFYKIVGYCGLVIQGISVSLFLLVTLPKVEFDQCVLSTEHVFEVAPEDNVFVFVLDWFDNQIMEQILEQEEEFLEPLDGFVRYTNVTSKYAFTDMSIPYLLTGIEWKSDELEIDYTRRAQEESKALELIADAGYTIGIYTESAYIGKGEQALVENARQTKRSLDMDSELRVMAKTTRYKTYPFFIKNQFSYSDDDVLDIKRSTVEMHNIYNDIPFVVRLLEEGISVDASRSGAFKFYHLHGAHTSYLMNEQFEEENTDMFTQSRASFKIVYEFIDQLKENNLYEDATIIITADHGQNYFDRPLMVEELGLELISSPILFVKESGACSSDIEVSMAPVSHEEVIPTVLEAILKDTCGYGRSLSEIVENESRERTFIYGRHHDIPFVQYFINGDVMNVENWSEAKNIVEE